jgi:hypothetical protein
MFENILLLIFGYLILSYLGLGIFALITPDSFRKPYLYALVAPGFGLLLLVIIGSWVMATSTAITWTMILSLIMATGLNLFVLRRANIREKISIKRFRLNKKLLLKVLGAGVLLLGILCLIVLPGVKEGNLTTPLRTGPDSTGYAGAAQTLVEGGTLSSIAEDLKAATGKEDLEEAKKANFQLLRFDLHCSSEFLLKALRWGYPTVLANMTWVTDLDSVYRLDFVLLIFPWAMLLGLAYYACRTIIKARWFICLLLSGALVLNCNLLNIYYEGSYAEVMAIPIFFMLLLYLYNIRENDTFKNTQDQIKQIVFVGFLGAALLSIWTEACIVLGIICFIILVLDLLQIHKTQKTWMSIIGLGALLAFILVAPLTWSLILFYKNYFFLHLGNITQGGWWQPQWATLSEIMGWTNIYAHGSLPALVQRNTIEVVLAFFGSIFIAVAALSYLFSNNRHQRSFWLASIVFVVLVFLVTGFLDRTNYQYYKAYTMFLPIMFLLVYAAIFFLIKIIKSRWKYVLYGIVAVCIGITVYNGISYIKKYNRESSYVTEEMFALKKSSEPLSNYVLMMPFASDYSQYINWSQLAATEKLYWYNFYFTQIYKKQLIKELYLDMPVAIIFSSDELKQFSTDNQDIVYAGREFQVIKTPYKLRDRLDEHGTVDVNNYFNFGDTATDSFTRLLLHFDVTDSSTIFTDEPGDYLSFSGNAHIDAVVKKLGTGSGSFDGDGDYLTIPDSADFDFGSGDFTIDGWFYFMANDTGYQFMLDRRGTNDGTGWIFYLESNNQLSFLSSSATGWDNLALYNTGVVPETGKWMHLAVVRHGDVFTMYQNGVAIKSGTFSGAIGAPAHDLTIGNGHASPGGFNGYIDELRISQGIARWTSNFTPPALPYTEINREYSPDEPAGDNEQ